MSQAIDYSKFDKIEVEDSDSDQEVASSPAPRIAENIDPAPNATMTKDPKSGRFIFQFKGREIYQWEQNLDEVIIYIASPPNITRGNQINIIIKATNLQVGLVGRDEWYLDEPTFGTVDTSESTWSLEDGIISIYLSKAHRGEMWESALRGNRAVQLDPQSKEDVKKELMKQRFQEENPGFDFRDAEFNGGIPDARTFMGGVKYD
mmetsp:Transcript_90720/g.261430  ORF Transcript_90720/g.261430 Transcript_90720/m.261430 type:complete len:205 (-) Transcript_90720:167-781(-)|eukprot:CAMPEP_0176051148 /NCGR_PEP_ID=MMETSP0120_2-20121206/25427_1 /TAXON_ID=160619 /ORGANISM="Kryptoperidinium foliaceum, Strain CCMP 1326" /LENGTH=204 /DNA_ID=CAMNT_0017384587 /DNA_START=231 /DNA_END=845 /DNA_ORIENTATION=-